MECPTADSLLGDYRKAVLLYLEAVEDLRRSDLAESGWTGVRSAHDTCETTLNVLRDHFKKHGCLRRSR